MKSNKKNKIILFSLLLMFILLIVSMLLISGKQSKKDKQEDIHNEPLLNIALNDNGIPKYIGGTFSNKKVTDEETALNALKEIQDMMKIKNVSEEFYLLDTYVYDSIQYYELQQKYKGIDILGGELTLSVDKDGKILGMNGNYIPNITASTTSLLSESQVKSKILKLYGEESEFYSLEKYVYVDGSESYVVYIIDFACNKGVYEVVMNAKSGAIVTEDDAILGSDYTYTGTGLQNQEHTITINKKYVLLDNDYNYEFIDKNRNIQIFDSTGLGMDISGLVLGKIFSSWTPFTASMQGNQLHYHNPYLLSTAITTMKYYEDIYDYYKNVLGRDSYDGKGGKIRVNIGVSETTTIFPKAGNGYVNASWLFNQMYIGSYNGTSFAIGKDILAHEFTHGVVSKTSKFSNPTKKNRNKVNETGALNEGYADILGSLIEGKNWTIGEDMDVDLIGRDLTDPQKYKYPAAVGEEYYFPDAYLDGVTLEEYLKAKNWTSVFDYDKGGVHHNSTVVGHAAYLMYQNGAFESMEQMAQVWYQSLLLLSAHSNFEDCAYAVIQSAINLNLSKEKVNIIKEAFIETKMLSQEYYNISGKVEDIKSKKAISLAVVTVTNRENPYIYYEVYTNSNGEYTFQELPAGEYMVSFEKGKYKTEEKELDLTQNIAGLDAQLSPIAEANFKSKEIVFVLDISLSMDTSDPTDIRKQIIGNILSSVDNESKVALVVFAKNGLVVNDGLSNKYVDRKILMTDVFNITNDNGYTSNSGTNGRAGLQKGLSLFSNNTKAKKYIIFLTDGEDNVDEGLTYSQLIEEANQKRVRILTIGLGSDENINVEELKNIANKTNGKYYRATSSSELYKFDKRILEELE